MKYCIAVLLLSLSLVYSARSQTSFSPLTSNGTEFYLGMIPPAYLCNYAMPYESQYALVSSYYGSNTVTVSYFDPVTGAEQTGKEYKLDSLGWVAVKLDPKFMARDAANNLDTAGENPAAFQACRIRSQRPVSVQYYSTGPNGGAMYLALPTSVLGKHYIAMCLPSNPAIGKGNSFYCSNIDYSSSLFSVIATEDDTHVKIIPTAKTRRLGIFPKQVINVTLKRGQCYMVKANPLDEEADMSGSQIVADKPIGVLAGQEGAFNGESRYFGTQEQRDLSLEMMVPVEYWKSSGHVSMPLADSGPFNATDNSNGEGYKVFTPDSANTTVDFEIDQLGTRKSTLEPYQNPPPYFQSVMSGVNAHSENGRPIFVEMYDYRQHNTREPYPAPSQMNIVPLTEYTTSAIFSIMDDAFQVHKTHYINVIGYSSEFDNGKIKVSINGKPAVDITSLPGENVRAHIPDHPELSGRRYVVTPGTYYIHGDSAFVVYGYGMLGLDPDADLGDNDGDDYYFSYASPYCQSFSRSGATKPKVSVDSSTCGRYALTVTDDASLNGGLAIVELLNDPAGIFARPAYVSSNVKATSNSPLHPGDAVYHITFAPVDPSKPMYAAVNIVNKAGEQSIVEINRPASGWTLSATNFDYGQVPIDTEICRTAIVRNGTNKTIQIQSVSGASDKNLTLSTNPPLPASVKAGDSLMLTLCLNTDHQTIHVIADTIALHTDCYDASWPVFAYAHSALIIASDLDFGTVLTDEKKFQTLRVSNIGDQPLIVNSFEMHSSSGAFAFPDSGALPFTLTAGNHTDFTVFFHPIMNGPDTAWITWNTSATKDLEKSYSAFRGNGLQSKGVSPSNEAAFSLSVHPNPSAGGRVTIECSESNAEIAVLDVLGREVRSLHLTNGQHSTMLSLDGIPAGLYYVRASANTLVATHSLVLKR